MEPQEDDNVIQLSVPGGTPRRAETIENPPQPGTLAPARPRLGDAVQPALPAFNIPQWVWVAGGAIIFLGLVYYLQKGHVSKTRQVPWRRVNPAKPHRGKPAPPSEEDDDDPN